MAKLVGVDGAPPVVVDAAPADLPVPASEPQLVAEDDNGAADCFADAPPMVKDVFGAPPDAAVGAVAEPDAEGKVGRPEGFLGERVELFLGDSGPSSPSDSSSEKLPASSSE
jgi:hypothetical protein